MSHSPARSPDKKPGVNDRHYSACPGTMGSGCNKIGSNMQHRTNRLATGLANTRNLLNCQDGERLSGGVEQLARWQDIPGQGGLRFELSSALPKSSFCSFIERSSKSDVVGFFREIAHEVEVKRGLLNYHLKVRGGHLKIRGGSEKAFWVDIYYGDNDRNGPYDIGLDYCPWCSPEAPLFPGQEPGVTAAECVLPEFNDQPHVHCSLDAKARAGFVIFPVRHVERMSELQDDELFVLWSTAVRALQQSSLPAFKAIIVNHGTYRATTHLRLTVSVDELQHEQLRLKWSSEKLDLWNRLLALGERTRTESSDYFINAPCFYNSFGVCTKGAQCRFLHIPRHINSHQKVKTSEPGSEHTLPSAD